MIARLSFLPLLLLGTAAPAHAAPDPGPLAVKVIETVALPGYQRFAAATQAQAGAWAEACASVDPLKYDGELRAAYQTAADSWSAVEFITTGPVSVSLRPDRIFFGADRRNYVAKAIADLSEKAKAADLSPEQMRSVSVAGQGFPALERLIWEPGALDKLERCRIGTAISKNLSSIASDILTEWLSADGPLAKLKAGKGDPLHFADPAQAAARLLTDLAGGVQRMNDVKLLPVLGSSVETARPKAAEGWRSGRSARAIRVSVTSLSEMAKVFAGAASADIAAADGKAFKAASEAVAKLPEDLGEAVGDPERRKPIESAVAALKAAQRDLAKNVAPALGIPLGFNALDGD